MISRSVQSKVAPRSKALMCLMTHALLMIVGCAEMPQERVELPLLLKGVDLSAPISAKQDVNVTLDRAELAFGPLYLCAGATAGHLCETARLEWLGSAVVDMTSPEAQRVGALSGVTGSVRSWMYDLGISSQLTQLEPFTLDAARELDNSSLILEGDAQVGEITIPFRAKVSVQQTEMTELGVPVVRKGTSTPFFQEVTGAEEGLMIQFDPSAWVRTLDFSTYVRSDTCEVDGEPLVCRGTEELSCEGAEVTSSRDCAADGEICLPRTGCASHLEVSPDSQLYRALRNALMSGARPSFQWLD